MDKMASFIGFSKTKCEKWSYIFLLHWLQYKNVKRQPASVLLPGKFHGWRSLAGYSPWGCKELDTTEQFHFLSMIHARGGSWKLNWPLNPDIQQPSP